MLQGWKPPSVKEKPDKPDKPDKPEKPEKAEKPEKVRRDGNQRVERAAFSEAWLGGAGGA